MKAHFKFVAGDHPPLLKDNITGLWNYPNKNIDIENPKSRYYNVILKTKVKKKQQAKPNGRDKSRILE